MTTQAQRDAKTRKKIRAMMRAEKEKQRKKFKESQRILKKLHKLNEQRWSMR